ncbi:MAG: 3-dehydroquinate synthase [Terracoccus sp.]
MNQAAQVTTIAVGDDYDVLIGSGVMARIADQLGDGVERVLVVHPPTLPELTARVADALSARGLDVHLAPVPDAEGAKTIAVAAGLWAALGQAGFTRTDAVVGLGGGSVTDLAGFVAATWLRGVPVVQVPTTLLGMVDAAVGGKTGINTAEGKNLVGAFHPPLAVLCDLDVLATLPEADLVAGLAEMIKCGFIDDPVILDLVEADPVAARRADNPALREMVERAVRVKARVVAADLRESSLREILNYGHTFGHAIEQVEQFAWRHGEAVSVGMVYVAELARLTGHLPGEAGAALVARHRSVLTAVGLPTRYRDDRWPELLTAMGRDKKSRGSRLRFVVLDGLAQPTRLEGPSPQHLRAAYRLVSTPAPPSATHSTPAAAPSDSH